jgi:Ca2+-binding RTX toxin-like protein
MSPPSGPSIVGGAQLYLTLDSRELTLAQQAIAAIGNGFADEYINHTLGTPAVGGQFNVYNPDLVSGDSASLPVGGQVLAAYGDGNVDLFGHDPQELLIGNSGNDSINAGGGSGTIVAGPGQDTITLNSSGNAGGDVTIDTGPQSDTINLWGGDASVNSPPAWGTSTIWDYVNLLSGANTIVGAHLDVYATGGTNVIDMTGPSAISFDGNGSDTVRIEPSAPATHVDFLGGTVSVILAGNGGDELWISAGNNSITDYNLQTTPEYYHLLGGDNALNTKGPATFELVSGTNTITVGGSAQFNESGGANTLLLRPGQTDSIDATGGDNTITLFADDTVNVVGGANTISEATGTTLNLSGGGIDSVSGNGTFSVTQHGTQVSVNGNDTITFGSGADTMVEFGTATVYSGGTAGITVQAGLGTTSIAAGSGNATLLGGSGNDTFAGSSGFTSMVGGAAQNYFVAGVGTDSMTGAGTYDRFTFNSALSGGTHVITNFNASTDHIQLIGYTVATALADSKVVGGNTVITLDSGKTTITLDGFTHLQASNFI